MTANDPTQGQSVNSVPHTIHEVSKAINNPRRRKTIVIVDGVEEPIEVGTLAMLIAALETDSTIQEVTSRQRKRVYVSLYQNNLQSLQETGVIEYRERAGEVQATDGTAGVAMLVRALEALCSDTLATEAATGADR